MLSRQDIQDVVELIVDVAGPERIILFGSHARGDAHASSDLDLLVLLDSASDLRAVGQAVRRAIMERRMTTPVELVFRHATDFEARRQRFADLMWVIDREGQEVHAA